MGMTFNGAKPFEQIVNSLSTEGFKWNLAKIAQAVSEKKPFKNCTILYMHIVQGQGQIISQKRLPLETKNTQTPRGQNFDYN